MESNEAYIEQLRVSPLRPKGPLPRVTAGLLETVRNHGVIEPVIVRRVGQDYEILGNVEYWMAAQQARLERVPIHVLDCPIDEDAAEIAAASYSGFQADPIEEAEYFQSQLAIDRNGRSKHRTVLMLAHQTGHARAYISHSLRLLKLPIEVQDLVRSGRLAAGHARAILRLPSAGDQRQLARQVVERGLSVRQTEDVAKAGLIGSEPATTVPTKKDPNVLRLEKRVSESLGCVVRFDVDSQRLEIDYHNMEILDGVLARLGVSVE